MTARPAFFHATAIGSAPQDDPVTRKWPATRQICLGLLCVLLLLGGFGGWAMTTRIAGALVTQGQIGSPGQRQVVQHRHGGVVADLRVANGDRVERGQVLLRLDPGDLEATAEVLRLQRIDLMMRAARWRAERDDLNSIPLPPALDRFSAGSKPHNAVRNIVDRQRDLFRARTALRAQTIDQLEQMKTQIDAQITSTGAREAALAQQLALLREDLTVQSRLFDQGLTQAPRVLALRRQEAAMIGQTAELAAHRAALEERAIDAELQILRVHSQVQEQATAALSDLARQEADLDTRLRKIEADIADLRVTAPFAGVVHDLKIPGPESVLSAGAAILSLVPTGEELIARARIAPAQIDRVYPGQPTLLRFPVFDTQDAPEISGQVDHISADVLIDPATGQPFFEAVITFAPEDLVTLGETGLRPGMPVEAYIRTADHTALGYLIKPLADYVKRAFREG